MNEFTLLDFSGDTKDEKTNERLTQPEQTDQLEELEAPEQAVQNVLNYSKALSMRKSNSMNYIKNVMN